MGIPHGQCFERLAPHYDILLDLLTFRGYANFLKKAIKVLSPLRGETVLDLCSGTGRVAHWIAQAVGPEGRVMGMDITPRMVDVARGRYGGSENLVFFEQDVTQPWPFQDVFDGIFISFGLHELPDVERPGLLKRSFFALKERGRMVIADFNPAPSGPARILSLLFFNLFERRNLDFLDFDPYAALKEAGFEGIEISPVAGGLLQITQARKG